MTTDAAAVPTPAPPAADPRPAVTAFVRHAKLIGGLTLVSRVFGLAREMVAGHFLGDGGVGTAFSVAFQVPNLFRKLFGEGALSAAFVPLYSRELRAEAAGETPAGSAAAFAATTVNLLVVALAVLTVVGEAVIAGFVWVTPHDAVHAERLMMLRLTAVMLPYVMLICTGAFLGGLLQVHRRFGPPAAAPILLNVVHIAVLLFGARLLGFAATETDATVIGKQTTLAYWLAGFVLVAGVLQLAALVPSARRCGFRFGWFRSFWTPAVRRMLVLSLPVAIGAGVLQVSVALDQGISFSLEPNLKPTAGSPPPTFTAFGHAVRYPLAFGAPRRLGFAQTLYQFPLGVFAIALATAIFPGLSADALDKDRDRFRAALRHGIEASLWEGLPASLGLILVAEPVARLVFQHGQVDAADAALIARSTAVYAGAIWAFSLLQILNRAFYALHDTRTPLVLSVVNIVVNLAVEVPLLWWRGESAMAVGTLVSFAVQAVVTLWLVDRRVDGLGLRRVWPAVLKMAFATALMGVACVAVRHSPLYPTAVNRPAWAAQLLLLLGVGAGVYLAACKATGVNTMDELFGRRRRRASTLAA